MKTKSESAKINNLVRQELKKIRDEHAACHTGSIWNCPKCKAAWKTIEAIFPGYAAAEDP